MNVIISNQQDNILSGLNIEVIKSIQGEFDVNDIVASFSNFFFSRMILDVTALLDYTNIVTYQKLSIGLPTDKIILLLPSQTIVSSNEFLSKLISMGYYNFTTNLEGLVYLIDHPNSYKDVAHIHQLDFPQTPAAVSGAGTNGEVFGPKKTILGIKNVTEGAGATTLTYAMYKALNDYYGVSAAAIEVQKRDFTYYNDPELISVNEQELANALLKKNDCDVILIDLNNASEKVCTEMLYLVEPSIIKMNKLIRRNRNVFNELKDKKIVLNKSLLVQSDVKEFEKEIGTKLYFVMPPFDDRRREQCIEEILQKLGIIGFQSK